MRRYRCQPPGTRNARLKVFTCRLSPRSADQPSTSSSGSYSQDYRSNERAERAPSSSTSSKLNASSRRILLSGLGGALLSAVLPSSSAQALGPTWPISDFPGLPLINPPPDAVKFPRRVLDQRFAVLLLRSTYDACDKLDFIPMDLFQKSFWLLRQSQFEPYKYLYDPIPIQVGDLVNPIYFDFISSAQYQTVSKLLENPPRVFEEFCEVPSDNCENGKRVIIRPASSEDAKLPGFIYQDVGDQIIDGLVNGFRGEDFGLPPPLQPSERSTAALMRRLQAVLDIFLAKGFAISGSIEPLQRSDDGAAFKVSLVGPANLWSVQTLENRRARMVNAYLELALESMARQSGFAAAYTFRASDAGTESEWKVTAATPSPTISI